MIPKGKIKFIKSNFPTEKKLEDFKSEILIWPSWFSKGIKNFGLNKHSNKLRFNEMKVKIIIPKETISFL